MARPERTSAAATDDDPTHHWLPNFCSWPVLFALVVIGELVALIVVLAASDVEVPTWESFGTASLFVQWLAVIWTVCLCKARPLLLRLAPWMGEFAAYTLMLVTTVLASWIVFAIDRNLMLGLISPEADPARFILRNSVICALIGGAVLRYFYVQEQWRARIHAEERARFEALQARIRPHFLFNSMNVIASLIRARPVQAEAAVEDLSDLFRAALGREDARGTLGEELDLARGYLRIEQLRLGDRLAVDWRVDALPRDLELPSLLLQPLVENAVYHGIQPLPEGGTVEVAGSVDAAQVEIVVRNPCPPPSARRGRGNGMALANIRSRLALHYGERASLAADDHGESYECRLRLPLVR
ncbi:MAG TPA: sensor histidine kinase [Tahibacter sp.]|uniref:sensor histidine kinase n=1 Tax=Tahibacter sp. TaxID=2056211 RepID=UPI002BFC3B19|nr:sensor histidine kinase [Tahibacter sp.]HSX61433.1 sensor histidine kinase [Tahibacter sp.]